ncbi:hypothetical protein RAZWK3B_12452 [Roseobacter sp. AzwK-3b]|nr:hypothetical protein RAZWK3B_12452 [Roseobacter sp. AzwK-3b]
MLLRDIADLFATRTGHPDRIASSELVADLITMEDRPWAEWRHGKPLTTTTIAKLIKPFGIKATVRKLHGTSARVYLRSEVEAAAARYCLSKCNRVTLEQNQEVSPDSKCNLDDKVTPQDPSNPLKTKEGYAVTLSETRSADAAPAGDPHDPEAWR